MPAQKRALQDPEDDLLERDRHEGPKEGDAEGTYPFFTPTPNSNDADSDRSPSSSNGDKDEFVLVKLSDIRKEVQCPICLGIIRKTRTVMECLHRFCRGCIDKSMRLGNNECPACRTHCASRRSLRDDPNYDALIAAFYPDIDKYEEEELAFQEEEKARNKQIQALIAQTVQRQSEGLGKKRPKFVQKTRGRINGRNGSQPIGFDDNEEAYGKDSSSADEHIEKKLKRFRKRGSGRFSQLPAAATSAYGGGDEHNSVENREIAAPISGLVGSSERLAWGKNGTRSHIRFGSMSNSNGKNLRNNRISKLVDRLRTSEDNDEQSNINLMLVSLDEQMIPALKRPYLHCRPSLSVKNLCQYVALQTELQVGEVEMYMLNELHAESNPSAWSGNALIGRSKDKIQLLEEVATMGELKKQSFTLGSLFLAFQKKANHTKHC